jgi:hypothetical protein
MPGDTGESEAAERTMWQTLNSTFRHFAPEKTPNNWIAAPSPTESLPHLHDIAAVQRKKF